MATLITHKRRDIQIRKELLDLFHTASRQTEVIGVFLRAGDDARLIVSPRTIQDWEQGRRVPNDAALKLLAVAAKHPEVLLDV